MTLKIFLLLSVLVASMSGPLKRALWKGKVIAESLKYETVEGNIYFPPDSLKAEHFTSSTHTSICGWKGTASYYNVVVDGAINENAAWYYPETKAAANNIKGYVAFWKGVVVE
jgi:uncharacterized protein (DUF427 family)